MSITDELLGNNEMYAASFDKGDLPMPPGSRSPWSLAWTRSSTCTTLLGLQKGDAHVSRNVGGVVLDDEIRSLAISQRQLGARAIILIHDTECGMLTFSDDELKPPVQAETGIKPEFALDAFSYLDEDVRQSITHQGQPAHPTQGECVRLHLRRSHRSFARGELAAYVSPRRSFREDCALAKLTQAGSGRPSVHLFGKLSADFEWRVVGEEVCLHPTTGTDTITSGWTPPIGALRRNWL